MYKYLCQNFNRRNFMSLTLQSGAAEEAMGSHDTRRHEVFPIEDKR